MGNEAHLTKAWLTLFLLQEVPLAVCDKEHLVGCAECLKLLTEVALEIAQIEHTQP